MDTKECVVENITDYKQLIEITKLPHCFKYGAVLLFFCRDRSFHAYMYCKGTRTPDYWKSSHSNDMQSLEFIRSGEAFTHFLIMEKTYLIRRDTWMSDMKAKAFGPGGEEVLVSAVWEKPPKHKRLVWTLWPDDRELADDEWEWLYS